MAFCYINGAFKDELEASIPLSNLGATRGFGIFDFFRTRNGKPCFLEDYLDRFERSQEPLHLSSKIGREEVKKAVERLLELNDFEESTFKLVLLGDGNDKSSALHPFFYILHAPYDSNLPEKARVLLLEYVRDNPSIKSINYFKSFALHQRKQELGAFEVIFHRNNVVSEASRSNVFIVKDGSLKTTVSNVLSGITRKHILEASKAITKPVIEDFTLDELLDADEVFICSTLKGILPIYQIEDHIIGGGEIGEMTIRLQKRFQEYLREQGY